MYIYMFHLVDRICYELSAKTMGGASADGIAIMQICCFILVTVQKCDPPKLCTHADVDATVDLHVQIIAEHHVIYNMAKYVWHHAKAVAAAAAAAAVFAAAAAQRLRQQRQRQRQQQQITAAAPAAAATAAAAAARKRRQQQRQQHFLGAALSRQQRAFTRAVVF